ncbi:MAG: YggS family pyridoxal phosphate-dependent enzyme [Treponema sp.]|nr:YggS family pyridoxal phosphate-dependent enzyme [Treponema sp.]
MSITANIAKIEERIQKACVSAGRKREEIILMGVSKFVPAAGIEEAAGAGICYFGESRVQEAAEKLDGFKDKFSNVKLHMIGSLQRNKAKIAAVFFDNIQSVDRLELVAELAKYVQNREKPLEVLLELRTGEESKSGFTDFNALCKAAEKVLNIQNIKPAGLMTMAPFFNDMSNPDSIKLVRSSFRQLVKAQKELEKHFPSGENGNWHCLSMGMSNDFEIAIEEGSTMLRIGSLIFKD